MRPYGHCIKAYSEFGFLFAPDDSRSFDRNGLNVLNCLNALNVQPFIAATPESLPR